MSIAEKYGVKGISKSVKPLSPEKAKKIANLPANNVGKKKGKK